jgi:ribonuclease HI
MPTTTRSRRSGDESPGRARRSRRPTRAAEQLRILIYTDGAARGNPGPAGAGAILRDAVTGATLAEIADFLGVRTNNFAEWTAVELALQKAIALGATHVDLRLDSELVARQISGRYRVKHPDLKPIHARVMSQLATLAGYSVAHVPRELNKDADRLSNVAIDGRG